MRSFKIGTLVVALMAAAAPALIACSVEHGDAREAAGSLNLNLSGTGSSGSKYRLRNATFTVAGPKAATLSSETNVDSPVIKQELPAGNFLITLKTGWTLEKSTDGGMTFANVKAVLTSANPAGFTIFDQGQTTVAFSFNAGDDVVQLGDGTLNVVINVNDGCPAGQSSCGNACVDLHSDPFNCGACGLFCGFGNQCVNGVCQPACPAGTAQCNGACVDIFNDPQNCGGCGVVCTAQMGTVAQCAMGQCFQTCFGGLTQCGGACVDIFSDPQNCGACGLACAAGNACANGACVPVNGGAANVTTQFLTQETSTTACGDFQNFQAQIGAGPYNFVSLKSEFGLFTCATPDAQIVCQALRTGGFADVMCDGHIWHVGQCGGSELTVDNTQCACASPGAAYRPCIGNLNWGGVGTDTCAAPSQTISVTCSP